METELKQDKRRGAALLHVSLAAQLGQKRASLRRLEARYNKQRSLLLTQIHDLELALEEANAKRDAVKAEAVAS
jgi:hypothetical protein